MVGDRGIRRFGWVTLFILPGLSGLLLFTMTMGCASLGAIRMSRRMAPGAATSPVRERGILTTRQAEARG